MQVTLLTQLDIWLTSRIYRTLCAIENTARRANVAMSENFPRACEPDTTNYSNLWTRRTK